MENVPILIPTLPSPEARVVPAVPAISFIPRLSFPKSSDNDNNDPPIPPLLPMSLDKPLIESKKSPTPPVKFEINFNSGAPIAIKAPICKIVFWVSSSNALNLSIKPIKNSAAFSM